MFRRFVAPVSVLAVMGMGVAQAADAPLPRDWSGFYAGIHVGLATGTDSRLETSSRVTGGDYCYTDGGSTEGECPAPAEVQPAVQGQFWITDRPEWCLNTANNKVSSAANGQCNGNFQSLQTGPYCTDKANGNGTLLGRDENDCTGNGGGGNGNGTYVDPYNIIEEAVSDASDDLNFIAGVNLGFNYQHDSIVFGLEADLSAIMDDEERLHSEAFAIADGENEDGSYASTIAHGEFGLSNVMTLRARLGYDIDGRWLPFVTGGLAWGRISTEGTAEYAIYDAESDTVHTHSSSFGDSGYELGWTLGAGLNYRVAEGAFIGLTYLYTDLGEHGFGDSYLVETDYGELEGKVDGEVDAKFHTVRLSFDVMF